MQDRALIDNHVWLDRRVLLDSRAFIPAPGAVYLPGVFSEPAGPDEARSPSSSATFKIVSALFLSKDAWIPNLLAFLAARAGVLEHLYPFGPAFFAAVLLTGERKRAAACALSVVLGAATVLPWHRTLATLAFVALAMLAFRPVKGEKRGQGRRTTRGVAGIVLLFASVRLVLLWAFGGQASAVSVLAEAGLVAAVTVIALPAAAMRWLDAGTRYDRPAVVAMGLFVAVAGLGLGDIAWNALHFGEVWNRWATLLAALVGGVAGGAAMGTAAGVFASLAGGHPLGGLGLYSVAGLCAGLFARSGKAGVAFGFALGQVAAAANASGAEDIILGAAHTGLALVLLSFTPSRWIARVHRNIPGSDAQREMQLARETRLREAMGERLRQIGSVFSELADVFARDGAGGPRGEEGIRALIEQVCERQCRSCSGYKACWQEQFYQSYWETVDLVALAERKGSVAAGDLSWEFRRRCFREREFVEALNRALQHHRPGREAAMDIVPEQLKGAARLVESVAGQVKLDTTKAEEIEGLLRDEFGLKGIEFDDVRVSMKGERADVEVLYSGPCDGYGSCAVPLLVAVERVLGERYTCEPECRSVSERRCRVRLVPEPPAVLCVKVARLAKGGTAVCGDAYGRFELGGGKVALALSDGMGSGGRAALESRAAIGLLEKMLRAGFDREFAARAINAALLARSTDECFATLDLAVVDQFTGEVEFLKVGSAPTFIKRAGGVEIVRSNALPVGILSEIDLTPDVTRLRAGDALVMMTDGVLDSLPHRADKEEWIARALRRADTRAPEELARLLVEKARQAAGGVVKDDMTVLVAQLRYRPRAGAGKGADDLVGADDVAQAEPVAEPGAPEAVPAAVTVDRAFAGERYGSPGAEQYNLRGLREGGQAELRRSDPPDLREYSLLELRQYGLPDSREYGRSNRRRFRVLNLRRDGAPGRKRHEPVDSRDLTGSGPRGDESGGVGTGDSELESHEPRVASPR